MGNPNQSEVCAPSSTYRELPGDRIEAHVDRVLEISWVRYIRLRVVVRRLGPLDLVLQRLLLAVQVLGLCKRCEEQMGSSVQDSLQFRSCMSLLTLWQRPHVHWRGRVSPITATAITGQTHWRRWRFVLLTGHCCWVLCHWESSSQSVRLHSLLSSGCRTILLLKCGQKRGGHN